MIERNRRKEQWESMMRTAIVEAVVHVLTHEGADRLTMDRVAQEAGVAKGTLYSYFQDKAELVEAAIQAKLEPMRAELAEVFDSGLGPRDTLVELLRRYLAFFDRERDGLRVLLFERQKSQHPVARHKSSRYRAIVDRFERLIAEGIEGGEFRPVDPAKVASMILDASLSVGLRRLTDDARAPVAEDVNLLAGVFLRGLDAGDTRAPFTVPRETSDHEHPSS